MVRSRKLLAVLVAAVLASAGCSVFGEDDETAQQRGGSGTDQAQPAAAQGSASTTTRSTGRVEEPTTQGGQASGEGLEVVPDVVQDVQPSVVAILTDSGEGSGVVYSRDGVVVTNNHVVEGEQRVRVAFADGDQESADVVATDPRSDLAIVRVDGDAGRDLPAATFAEGLPRVGELAIAMGAPLGFQNSVTAGIVSGLGRSIPGAVTAGQVALIDLIQTDAAISPGNSGGALVDGEGRIIGINVAYIPPAGGAVNLGFAIPSPVVTDVVRQLLDDGRVSYPYLGVESESVTPQIARQFGLDQDQGAIVRNVVPSSPAATAGVQPGDIVVGIDGDKVQSQEELLARLRQHKPGQQVELRVLRNGQEQDLSTTLAERPQE